MTTVIQDQAIRDEDKIKQLVLRLIEEIYEYKYIGNLDVKKLKHGYKIDIYWRSDELPISIMVDLEYGPCLEEFLKKEIRDRKLHFSNHFNGWMSLPFKEVKNNNCYERKNR